MCAGPSVESVSAEFTVASFNLHGGVDAWGRRFDAVGSAERLGADVLFLQECWTPANGSGLAEQIAQRIGGTAHEVTLASGRRALPHPEAPATWHRRRSLLDGDHALYLDSELPLRNPVSSSARFTDAEPGSWGLAIVSRLPVLSTSVVHLGRLRRDRAHRALLVAHLEVDGAPICAVAVHMTHLTYGSPIHFRRLRRTLEELGGPRSATVIGGDMNLWGPAVSLQLPGWRRAIKAKTWPSWGPHSQLDHLLVGKQLDVLGGRVVDDPSSDHLPIVTRLRLRDARST